jgi:hypothetical protein
VTYHVELSPERPDPDTPSARELYRALREDATGEPGKRVKGLLERLRDDPGQVRAQSRAFHPGDWWAAEVEMPNGSTWWVVWRLEGTVVKVRWIGPDPHELL